MLTEAAGGAKMCVPFACVSQRLNPVMMLHDPVPDGQAGSPVSLREGNDGVAEMRLVGMWHMGCPSGL